MLASFLLAQLHQSSAQPFAAALCAVLFAAVLQMLRQAMVLTGTKQALQPMQRSAVLAPTGLVAPSRPAAAHLAVATPLAALVQRLQASAWLRLVSTWTRQGSLLSSRHARRSPTRMSMVVV
jgi:hypothetical protein